MGRIAFTLMAILAMTSVSYAVVTFDVVQNADPDSGLKSFTVRALGDTIDLLSKFTIDPAYGYVNQSGDEWIKVLDGETANPATDSCVVFGQMRLPDVAGGTWDYVTYPDGPPAAFTEETGVPGPNGTLNNFLDVGGDQFWDAYMHLATEVPETDLLRIVLKSGGQAKVNVTVVTGGLAGGSSVEYHDSGDIIINAPLDGDATNDGIVNLLDLGIVGDNYNGIDKDWETGDFTGDGIVNLLDLGILGDNYNATADWWVPTEGAAPNSVPEPSTIVMLALGALCLAGYRLRK